MDQREKERLLWNLKSLPNELADLINDLDDETLRWRPISGKWSAKEIVCHLRDAEREVHLPRYKLVLTEENPPLPTIDQERMAVDGDYINQDATAVLGDLTRLRAEIVSLLESTPLEAWSRRGVHRTAGPITIGQILIRQKDHDLNHLIQVKDIVSLKMPWCAVGVSGS